MKYFVSDIHGEYDLFHLLLDKLQFSSEDTLYICGDIIDKGDHPIKLAKYISAFPNIYCILGNHELAFLKYYHAILQTSPDDFDAVLRKLQAYFPQDGALLDWELVDWFEALPAYIEEEEFICVHAGLPTDVAGRLRSPCEVSVEQLVHDRRFKEPHVTHQSPRCVFFGHTQTEAVCGENRILAYRKRVDAPPCRIGDFYKIHLDTGAWCSGVLGCFCMDTLECIYVNKNRRFG